jgi:Fic family protein
LLEACQKGNGNITNWVIWFLNRIEDAARNSMIRLDKIRQSTIFWDNYRHHAFNERQRKLLIRLLETQDFSEGIAKRKYKNLVNTSDATAARDLQDLVSRGVLATEGKGRSVKYLLNKNMLFGESAISSDA